MGSAVVFLAGYFRKPLSFVYVFREWQTNSRHAPTRPRQQLEQFVYRVSSAGVNLMAFTRTCSYASTDAARQTHNSRISNAL